MVVKNKMLKKILNINKWRNLVKNKRNLARKNADLANKRRNLAQKKPNLANQLVQKVIRRRDASRRSALNRAANAIVANRE